MSGDTSTVYCTLWGFTFAYRPMQSFIAVWETPNDWEINVSTPPVDMISVPHGQRQRVPGDLHVFAEQWLVQTGRVALAPEKDEDILAQDTSEVILLRIEVAELRRRVDELTAPVNAQATCNEEEGNSAWRCFKDANHLGRHVLVVAWDESGEWEQLDPKQVLNGSP